MPSKMSEELTKRWFHERAHLRNTPHHIEKGAYYTIDQVKDMLASFLDDTLRDSKTVLTTPVTTVERVSTSATHVLSKTNAIAGESNKRGVK